MNKEDYKAIAKIIKHERSVYPSMSPRDYDMRGTISRIMNSLADYFERGAKKRVTDYIEWSKKECEKEGITEDTDKTIIKKLAQIEFNREQFLKDCGVN